jgi:hypothetical protein
MTFIPLASISPAHEALQKSLAKSIHEGISSKQIPSSVQKQYEIQLKHLQDKEPSCEFILWPLFRPTPSESSSSLFIYSIVFTLKPHPCLRTDISQWQRFWTIHSRGDLLFVLFNCFASAAIDHTTLAHYIERPTGPTKHWSELFWTPIWFVDDQFSQLSYLRWTR